MRKIIGKYRAEARADAGECGNIRKVHMKQYRYYIRPPREVYAAMDADEYAPGFKTYAEYNYLREGLAASIKTRHFEAALELTKGYFHRCNVIDFGCADGVFLPSLAKHFDQVLAVDRKPAFLAAASKLVEMLRLDNVTVRSNEAVFAGAQKNGVEPRYRIMYLLEVLEHIGAPGALYDSKIAFLKQVASLIEDDGLFVISVPTMIGIPFLLQRIGLAIFGLQREPISLTNLLKAGLLNDTDDLERHWQGETAHLGFNHKILEQHLAREFDLVKKKQLLFQMIYVFRK